MALMEKKTKPHNKTTKNPTSNKCDFIFEYLKQASWKNLVCDCYKENTLKSKLV